MPNSVKARNLLQSRNKPHVLNCPYHYIKIQVFVECRVRHKKIVFKKEKQTPN